ncbi:hypothetical protein Lfu02_48620 [Longispora fulva]|uniref:DUF4352 domain-containing protein n=1 Tax=Longispora fulva TaxID=619741 RepID=A0A8J7GTS3_9ACTN|nr:DUF4352 domain-containing protein [Longispora fulva]MBG6138238.1 hypothetical protein [Longispora fulva]GIG60490.1 hypothetical protein Lfu02_48620 [Longispora fulva]
MTAPRMGHLAVLCCIAALGTGFVATVATAETPHEGSAVAAPAATKAPAPPPPSIGTPVRDGKFEFVVKKVECGVDQVGGDYLNKSAQGQFCLVTLSVKNIGNKPQTMSDSNQKGFGANNARYSPDSTASLYANPDSAQVWYTEINPGNEVTGLIVFDIPKDGQLLSLELHDSLFSGGVKVKLQ